VFTKPRRMRKALESIALAAAVNLTGCYSTSAYRGDGNIARGTGQWAFVVSFPPVDLSTPGVYEFSFEGVPSKLFVAGLAVPISTIRQPESGSAQCIIPSSVHLALTSSDGTKVDERGGRLDWWKVVAPDPADPAGCRVLSFQVREPGSPPPQPIPMMSRQARYTLRVTVVPEGTSPRGFAIPVLTSVAESWAL
jgi:hypothetical protein